MKLLALIAALAPLAAGSTTANWEMNAYQEFLKGKFSGVALSRDGRLSLAPKLDSLYSPDQPQIWCMAKASDGSVYFGTGHRGRLYRVDAQGRGSLVWTAEQSEIFALAVDSKGVVYAGTSPDGSVYRIENGKAALVFSPGAKYIWAIAVAPDGTIYTGTGDQGKLFATTPAGKTSLYYDSGQAHITALAIDSEGRLLAGSEPNGILYRLTAPGKAFVLYDANLPEIRTILPASDGSIYAAALGGSVAKRTGTVYGNTAQPGGVTVTAPATSITVTDTNAQSGPEVKPPKTEAPKQPAPAQAAAQPVVQTVINPFEVAGVEKSAVYRIRPDNTVETVWSSKDENVYDIAAADGRLIFSTDLQGRIYRLGADRKATLLAQTSEGETTRLLETPQGVLAATGDMGKLYRLSPGAAAAGTYESPVHDSGSVARWGRLAWRAAMPAGSSISFRTRTGNSARPDNTWSDWSAPLNDPSGVLIPSPNARYLQWKAEFAGNANSSPTLDAVTAAYLPQNTPPSIRSITVTATPSQQKTPVTQAAASSTSAFAITVSDTAEPAQATSTGNPTQTLSRGVSQQTTILWQADDPEGDRLVYAIYFRGEDEQEWKLLRANFYETTLTLDADVLADGRYYFRVTASDRPSNAVASSKETELVSAPVLIDNTPPIITVAQRRDGAAVEVFVDAADQVSALRRCEYSVDAGAWFQAEAADGVTDSEKERFVFRLDKLTPGEHLVSVRVYDAAGNAGLGKVIVR